MSADHESIARLLGVRRAALKARVAAIDGTLREELSADFEEQAGELETQDALETMEANGAREIQDIDAALHRISDGSYGICVQCGAEIAPQRLAVLPTAAKCIVCASAGQGRQH